MHSFVSRLVTVFTGLIYSCILFFLLHFFYFIAESRFLQSVDEDNMTKQPGVSVVSPDLDRTACTFIYMN